MSHIEPALPASRSAGFTLIELMVAVAVIAILAAIAFPAFTDSIRKGRRSDAFTALSAVQQAQERWRGNNPSYAPLANTAASGSPPNGLGLSSSTPGGYYTISLTGVSATGYTAVATAVSGTTQANDGNCVRMSVRMTGGNIVFGSAAGSGDFNESSGNTCWAR